MASKVYLKHKAAIESGVYPEGLINGLRKAIHSRDRERAGYSVSVTASKMTNEEIQSLIDMIYDLTPRVSDAQAAKGIGYLRNVAKTPIGNIRKNNPFSDYELRVIFDTFSHFTIRGFYDAGKGMSFMVPIYGCHGFNAGHDQERRFDYYCGAWQSGGTGPILV